MRQAEGSADETFDIWPDNHDVWEVWRCLSSTQWRTVSTGGMEPRILRTGLDYAVIPGVLELLGIAPASRGRVFGGLREMELAALEVFCD